MTRHGMSAILSETGRAIKGRNILIVEDEYFLADDLARLLRSLGAEVLGPFGEAVDAMAALDGDPPIDAAVLDINLHNEVAYPLAIRLRSRAIPFLFASGYEHDALPEEFRGETLLVKPVEASAIADALTRTIVLRR